MAAGELAEKRAVVTGGTHGIGEAIVARLLQAGATVVAAARRPPAQTPEGGFFVEADLSAAAGAARLASTSAGRTN